ncbi:MAG: deoxyribodipyrimidine photo-lyase, partial [Dokdonella sp.]
MSTALVWFRRDLRLADNAALTAALESSDKVICAYVHAPEEEAPWQPGAASLWWLHHSLTALDEALRERGSRLLIVADESLQVIKALIDEHGIDSVHWNRLYDPAIIKRDKQIKKALGDQGVTVESHNGALF